MILNSSCGLVGCFERLLDFNWPKMLMIIGFVLLSSRPFLDQLLSLQLKSKRWRLFSSFFVLHQEVSYLQALPKNCLWSGWLLRLETCWLFSKR